MNKRKCIKSLLEMVDPEYARRIVEKMELGGLGSLIDFNQLVCYVDSRGMDLVSYQNHCYLQLSPI